MLGIRCRSGPTPVVIVAAHTGVTDGKRRDAVVDVHALLARSACSAGARPDAIARSSIEGLSASITTRTSFFGAAPALTAGSADPRTSGPRAAEPREQHPRQQRGGDDPDRRGEHRQHRDQRLRLPRRTAARPRRRPSSSRARTRASSGTRGRGAERRARDAGDQPRPRLVVVLSERPGEQQRAERQPATDDHERERTRAPPAAAPKRLLGVRQRERADHHPEQEGRALQEREVGALEVDLDVAGRQRADRERREERADADRDGDADPLEDVENQVHSAVP